MKNDVFSRNEPLLSMSNSPPSVLVRQLDALQRQRPTDRLVAFVPRPQLGDALRQAVALRTGHTSGLTMETVEQHAQAWAEMTLRAAQPSGRKPLSAGIRLFLTATALDEVEADLRSTLGGEQPESSLLRPLSRTFDMLRLYDVSPEEYRTSGAAPPHREALAEAFAAYEKLLDAYSLYDTALLYKMATDEVRQSHGSAPPTTFAIVDSVELPSTAFTFVGALREAVSDQPPGLYRLGVSTTRDAHSAAPPPDRVAAQFPNAPYPPTAATDASPFGRVAFGTESALTESEADAISFCTSTGVRREVQAVFEDIAARRRPLDTVEIAFTDQSPYLPLIDAMAERYGVKVSLSVGRGIEATRTGQLLEGFFDWIAAGFPVADLIRLLRSGLLQIDEPIGPDGTHGTLDSRRAATLLAERRYPPGPRGLDATLSDWKKELEHSVNEVSEVTSDNSAPGDSLDSLQEKLAAVKRLRSVIEIIQEKAQIQNRKSVRLSELAEGTESLIERFGPTPKPTGPDEDHTPDEAARNRLIERLSTLYKTPDLPAVPLRQAATRMSAWIRETPYVRARRPQPGRAHVVPLRSAGYANRDHLYVVGLDASSSASGVTENPLLTDDEREALSTTPSHLPLRRNHTDTEAWLTAQALARHEGSLTLSAPTHDLVEGEDLFESPLFLRFKEHVAAAKNAPTDAALSQESHHPLSAQPTTALTALDRWTTRRAPSEQAVSETIESRYPWIQHGLDAERARASDRYTEHDGLLTPSNYAVLNPLRRASPISAGQLEAYARAPYAYFLEHILGVEPLDEPALDKWAWLDALERGGVLHSTFTRFMSELNRRPRLEDEGHLRSAFDDVLDAKRRDLPPPSEVVFAATKRKLWADAHLFLQAEASRTDEHQPADFEVGFGLPPHRRRDGDYPEAADLDLIDPPLRLRGRIDRIDRHGKDRVSLWDYKTGSSREFEDGDLLQNGKHLQWALYAYAYEALTDDRVPQAGYFFTSTDEMGLRFSSNPSDHRTEVAAAVQRIAEGIEAGAFPVTDGRSLKYDYEALFHDFRARTSQLKTKDWPEERPKPAPLLD